MVRIPIDNLCVSVIVPCQNEKEYAAIFLKQYFQYGYWKVKIIQKHRIPASIRHLVPGGFVGTLLMLCILSFFFPWAKLLFLGIVGLYGFSNLVATFISCRKPQSWKYIPVMPLVFCAYHFGYGIGFLVGVVDFFILNPQITQIDAD